MELRKWFSIPVILLFFLMISCVTIVEELQTYPLGVQTDSRGSKSIHIASVQDDRPENAPLQLKHKGYDHYLTRTRGNVYFVEDPSTQEITEFVAAAVRSDIQTAGFTLAMDQSEADYSLSIVINRMESSRITNEDRELWGTIVVGAGAVVGGTLAGLGARFSNTALIAGGSVCIALAPLGMLIWADDLQARYSMSVLVVDGRTQEILLQRDYETDEKTSIPLSSRQHSPQIALAKAIQKSIAKLVEDLARVTQ